jgi:hypothetical protein
VWRAQYAPHHRSLRKDRLNFLSAAGVGFY